MFPVIENKVVDCTAKMYICSLLSLYIDFKQRRGSDV
jgi:hypothetical protein